MTAGRLAPTPGPFLKEGGESMTETFDYVAVGSGPAGS